MNRRNMKMGRVAIAPLLLVIALVLSTFGAATPVGAASKKTNKTWMTGIYTIKGKSALYKKGKVVKSANGLYRSNTTGRRYYLKRGAVNTGFTGLAKDKRDGKWYFFRRGKSDMTFTGVAKSVADKRWYFVRKGVYDKKFTGICRSAANKNWYYCKNGKLDWDFTGVAKSIANGRLYYVEDGKLDWSHTGTVTQGGSTYSVKKGVAQYAAPQQTAGVSAASSDWNGVKLNRINGTITGPSGKETYYNLDMSEVVARMRRRGNDDPYWVRSDGVKMLGNYVMVAANLTLRPRGSYVMSSLGMAIVVDTGGFASRNPTQLDIAVNW